MCGSLKDAPTWPYICPVAILGLSIVNDSCYEGLTGPDFTLSEPSGIFLLMVTKAYTEYLIRTLISQPVCEVVCKGAREDGTGGYWGPESLIPQLLAGRGPQYFRHLASANINSTSQMELGPHS